MKPKRIRVLVTGVGGDIGLSVIKCLADSGHDIDLFGCDIDPYAAGRKNVQMFLTAPKAINEEEFLLFISNTLKRNEIEFVLPTTEVEIELFNRNRQYFNKFGDHLLINNPFIVNTFLDKYKTVNFLKKIGLPYPATFIIEEYDNQLKFPLLMKPRKGCGSKGIIRIKDKDELTFFKRRNADAIVQEEIGVEDEEYTVGVFSDTKVVHSICFHRYLGYGSMSKFVRLIDSKELTEIVKTIAQESKLEGSINVQFRKSKKGYVPFEINPRLSSTVYFRHFFGFQDVKWWIYLKLNKPFTYNLKYKRGIGVRTVGEVFFELES